jgi:hypothetical protein
MASERNTNELDSKHMAHCLQGRGSSGGKHGNSRSNKRRDSISEETPRPLEAKFKKRVVKELKKIADLYFLVYEAGSVRGIPDIIGCYHGTFFAWELKRDAKESTCKGRAALQAYTLQNIRAAGGIACFVSPENFEDCLEELLCLENLTVH